MAQPGLAWPSPGIRNSRKEHMVEPAEPARPDSLGNRASILGHLATSVGPPGLGSTSGPSNQARRAGWAICAFNAVQPCHQRRRTGPAQPESRFIQTAQPTVPARHANRPVQLAELDRTSRQARQAAGPSSRAGNTASRTCLSSQTCRAAKAFRASCAIQPPGPTTQPSWPRPISP